MIINRKVIILGAGLTGLSAAYYLRNESVELTILEARDRTGGRIHTVRKEDEAPVEMGATWLGRKHRDLIGLLEELNLPIFEQRMSDRAIYQPISTSPPQLVTLPPNDDPTFRIGGGSGRLIDTLTDSLPAGTIRLGTIVTALRLAGEAVIITTNRGDYRADCVISTLPPHLFGTTISVEPALPPDLLALTARTHTWMGESIKVALTYAEPFWRAPGSSGTVFSSPGPATELYDHSTVEDDRYALKGFFSGAYAGAGREQRLELLLRQLDHLLRPGRPELPQLHGSRLGRRTVHVPTADRLRGSPPAQRRPPLSATPAQRTLVPGRYGDRLGPPGIHGRGGAQRAGGGGSPGRTTLKRRAVPGRRVCDPATTSRD